MRRDLFYFYPSDIDSVYVAYQRAIRDRLGKEAEGVPVHTLVFGLNFSFKFNMNGGGCHVHFMRYRGGTAVNIRYTIAQATGARYEAHADELNLAVDNILQLKAQKVNLDAELFEASKEERPLAFGAPKATPQPTYNPPMTFNEPTPMRSYAPMNNNPAPISAQSMERARFCGQCGTPFQGDANFCANCGAKRG